MLIRRLLIRLLGFKNYLQFISYFFLKTYRSKLYLSEHFQVRFLRQLVRQGDTCLDIGANLGYFSIPLSHLTGEKGKLYSIEPVPMFRKVLQKNLSRFGLKNFEILPYALGEEDHKKVQMGTPTVDGVIRHGRTEILEARPQQGIAFTHETEMMSPQTLFGGLKELQFVKCDVEGYETHIIPQFLSLFEQHQPILEIEIGPKENKAEIINLLSPLSYTAYYLKNNQLWPFQLDNPQHTKEIELYFIPTGKKDRVRGVIRE
ncbi:FkbM family methyltransferase [Rapidithrix thailandica]|uniref:FkbM family methyltransferase n=1 Tax=Rapidithrix thailandica TaxID=413964 RepID=A0AAW9SEA6_9BACT